MKKNNFATSELSLFQSVINYNNAPEFIRSSFGNFPRYFLHIVIDGKHYFGLSKFCAFEGISLLDYIDGLRSQTNGGNTQKRISRICKKAWIPYRDAKPALRKEFERWMKQYFPKYDTVKSNFITIKIDTEATQKKNHSKVDPDLLKLIGETGEKIALEYESKRVGVKGQVNHVSLENDASGYDIYSKKGILERFIEVKASQMKIKEFYITNNEITILKRLKDNAYLYLVTITDLERGVGTVEEIKNPWKTLLQNGNMKPVSFKFKF